MLKGKRVTLRAIERGDLLLLCQFNNDVEIELAGGGDPPYPQSLARMEADYESKVSKGGRDDPWFAIVVEEKLIGQCALHNFDDFGGSCELGIGIGDKTYWGKGYGKEAVQILLHWAFRYRNMRRVWLTTTGDNARAIRCYLACGFQEEGRQRKHVWSGNAADYVDFVYMGIMKEEWLKELEKETPE